MNNTAIEGAPSRLDSARYTINATAEGTPSRNIMCGPMLQALLEDRFNLKIHWGTKEVPVYTLTVAKGGHKLRPFKEGSCIARVMIFPPTPPPALPDGEKYCAQQFSRNGPNRVYTGEGMTINEFATVYLNGPLAGLDRPVLDKTGLTGKFDIRIEHAPPPGKQGAVEATAPSLFTAIKNQLGLKLESSKGPGEFLVIDGIHRPTEN